MIIDSLLITMFYYKGGIVLKQNVYEIEKNVERILRGEATGFLTNSVRIEVQKRLKKNNYEIFAPFVEAEKVILYSGDYPQVRLFQISCYKDDELKHSSIMGSLFGLNITSEKFGDIVKWQQEFYVYLLDDISDFVVEELRMVGHIPVSLNEVPIDLLKDFKREYEKLELIVSSLRIDTIVSRLIGCSRDGVNEKIKNQEIFINEEVAKRASNLLETGDVFSIRKCGKFRFNNIIGKTKKDNFIIEIDKYI